MSRTEKKVMYVTQINDKCIENDFDWKAYFDNHLSEDIVNEVNYKEIFFKIREWIKEDKFSMNLSLAKLLRNLLKDFHIREPEILELGAATGFLTRMLLNMYGGQGTLIDNCEESYQRFISTKSGDADKINYVIQDIFQLDLEQKYDIVCSFGLIEHFVDKSEVIGVHKKFLKKDGYLVILIPLDSNLSRTFFEIHPELNLGYRELMSRTEFREILNKSGFQVLRIERSYDYSYDYIAAVCRLME